MYKILYKNNDAGTDIKITPKPITLEQFCEIYDQDLIVEFYSDAEKDKKWYVTIESIDRSGGKPNDTYVRGFGSTQLKAMAQLVDEINNRRDTPLPVTLGRRGWIKRS